MKGNQAGDSATATFVVTATAPLITLTPNSGPVGTLNVAVSGNGLRRVIPRVRLVVLPFQPQERARLRWRSNSISLQCW